MGSPELSDSSLDQQFALLTVDYERTLDIADGLVSSRGTARGVAATAYLALLGLGVDNKSWAMCAAAALISFAFALQDIRTSWVYYQLVRRANRLERLFQRRMQALDRPYDPYPAARLRDELESYEFGVLSHLDRFHFLRALDRVSVAAVAAYLTPVAVAAVAAAVV